MIRILDPKRSKPLQVLATPKVYELTFARNGSTATSHDIHDITWISHKMATTWHRPIIST